MTTAHREWTWNQGPHGYDGVSTQDDGLLWFSHSHHSLAGGGAALQSYHDFTTTGPVVAVPDDVLAEVRTFVSSRVP